MPSQPPAPAPELDLVQVHGLTRSSFMLRSALALGTTAGATAVGPFVSSAFGQRVGGGAKSSAGGAADDIEIVNFALTLEYLETAFYQEAAKLKLSKEIRTLAARFAEEEQEHVDALTGAVKSLGGTAAKAPTFEFGVTDEKSFLKLAQTLEDTGVYAYNGAGPAITNKDILAAAGSIVQIEARHAAAIRLINDEAPSPDAFDKTLTPDEVLEAVKPLIVS